MADVSKIKLPSGVTYDIKDDGALPLSGGTVTGPVIFQDTISMDEATIGDLVVNGNASFTNGAHGVIDKAKAADVTSTLNALVKYEDTEGTFSDSNIYNTSNNLIVGSTSVPGNIQIGAKNDNYGILPNTNNYNQIGSSSLYWYRSFVSNYYGTNSHVTNWDAGKNIGTPSTSSAAATLGSVYFYNTCAAGGTQTKTLLSNGNASSNITITLPSATGTLALTSQLPTTTGSSTTGISISNHSTGSVIGVQSSTTTASKVTLGTAISVPNVTSVGSASTWTFEEKTIPNVTAAGSGSFTQGSFNGGSLTFAIDNTDNKQLNITFTAATHGADSHTHTAPTLGTAIKVQSKSGGGNGSAPTLGTAKSIPNVTGVSDVTVPIKNTSATTIVTSATHTVTDNGHTHNLS